MIRFMIVTFLILGWAFYEMSGGSDFVPEERIAAALPEEVPAEPVTTTALAAPETEEVTQTAPSTATIGNSIQERLATTLVTPSASEVLDATLGTAPPSETFAAFVPETEDLALADGGTVPETELAEDQTETPAIAEPSIASPDLRQVAGSRVNMRSGPSTDFAVLVTLDGGTTTQVLDNNDDGWVLVRVQDTGQEGWMAERLLEPVNG